MMIMILPQVFPLFAPASDAGVWFIDHRSTQKRADAPDLAAVHAFPLQAVAEDIMVLGISTLAISCPNRKAPWSNENADAATSPRPRCSPLFSKTYP